MTACFRTKKGRSVISFSWLTGCVKYHSYVVGWITGVFVLCVIQGLPGNIRVNSLSNKVVFSCLETKASDWQEIEYVHYSRKLSMKTQSGEPSVKRLCVCVGVKQ